MQIEKNQKKQKWYNLKPLEVIKLTDSSSKGLSKSEADKRLQVYGENKLLEIKPPSLFKIFIDQFRSPLIYLLLGAAIVIYYIGEHTDSAIIMFVLLFNSVIGAYQEIRAQKTLAALKNFVSTNATVMRDGEETIINDAKLVPGDLIILQEGDKVPADCRIFTNTNLTVDESALTGESSPVLKVEQPLDAKNLQTADQVNMVFKGTNVVAGSATAIVVATGTETGIGKVAKQVALIDTDDPLKKSVQWLSEIVIFSVLLLSASLVVYGALIGRPLKEMFVIGVSLAVSIVPEGLPIVMTLVLASGVWRMGKRNALVKKLSAVESLGQAQVIAVDKTGTITENQLVVSTIYSDGESYDVSGNGYDPKGEISKAGKSISRFNKSLLSIGQASTLSAEAHLSFDPKKEIWMVSGDPTEAAMLVLGKKLGFEKHILEQKISPVAMLPFSSEYKFRAGLHKNGSKLIATVMGAPEKVLSISSHHMVGGRRSKLSQKHIKDYEDQYANMTAQGLRVLALAVSDRKSTDLKQSDLKDMQFIGLVGMQDTLRAGVKRSVAIARRAGLEVVMITGDHPLTAKSIATQAGIYRAQDIVMTGSEVDLLTVEQLSVKLDNVSVFARVSPSHKLKIIEAFQKSGKIIAMTGDGVNDAPPLVAADLGMAMGKIGTEVAKEASDIILLDDNFSTIVSAIEEGRGIFSTIKKVILYLFSTNAGETIVICGALLLGWPIPIVASQIIWLNFVTDGFLDVSLAMEPKEPNLLSKHQRQGKSLFDKLMLQRLILMSVVMGVGTLVLISFYEGADFVKVSTMALTAMASFQWYNAWNCRSSTKSVFQQNFFQNKYLILATVFVIVLQVLAVYNPFFQNILSTTSLSWQEWGIALALGSTIMVAEEIRKLIYRRKLAS